MTDIKQKRLVHAARVAARRLRELETALTHSAESVRGRDPVQWLTLSCASQAILIVVSDLEKSTNESEQD